MPAETGESPWEDHQGSTGLSAESTGGLLCSEEPQPTPSWTVLTSVLGLTSEKVKGLVLFYCLYGLLTPSITFITLLLFY